MKVIRHSPDTNVFILALGHYASLCKNTRFIGTGSQQEIILRPIFRVLEHEMAVILPAFDTLS